MKIIFVVDSISDINKKVDALSSRFGNNICFVVKAPLAELFKTFGYTCNAIYSNNLSLTIHMLLLKAEIEDVLVYYSSLILSEKLLNDFASKIYSGKIVNVVPKYNAWENMCNSAYDTYVKTIFKIGDSFASPKLQFLPASFVTELLTSHFANRMFSLPASAVTNIYLDKGEQSNSAKIKTKFSKFHLIPIIAMLTITLALIMCLAFFKVSFALVFAFVLLYLLDLILFIIFQCKVYFDARFLKGT